MFGKIAPLRCASVLLMLWLQSCSTLHAQDKLLPIFSFQRINNLFSHQIRSRVVRDQEGFVWVGTLNGLERFDGYGVKDYRTINGDAHSLSSNLIPALLLDSKNRLWVGTFDAGISLYDRATDQFINLFPRAGDSSWYQGKDINGMMEDQNGNIWISPRSEGVARMTLPPEGSEIAPDSLPSAVRFTTYALHTPANSASDLIERSDGKILVASDSGLIILDPVTGFLSRLNQSTPQARVLDGASIECLRQDSNDVLWVGTVTEGLFRIDWQSNEIRNYRHRQGDTLSIISNHVQDIALWEDGCLWLGTDAGLQLFSPDTDRGIPYLTVGPNPSKRSYYTMLSVDRGGTLWIGTADGGVHWLSPKSRRIPYYGLPNTSGTAPRIFDGIERDRNGNLWFTSADKIFQIDIPSKKVLKVIDVFRGKVPTFADRVAFVDKNGTLWYSAWGLGLFRIDLESGQVSLYGSESGLGPHKTINGIAQASGDSLWIAGVNDGLMKFDPITGRFSDVPAVVEGNVWWLTRDRQGMIWVTSMTNGVSIVDPATGDARTLRHDPSDPHSLSSDVGRTVYQDPSGTMWIGAGNTIHRWDPSTQSVIRYPNRSFEKALFAQPLCLDGKGRLWVDFLHGGLGMLEPSTGTYTNFDVSDGVTVNLNVTTTLEDGTILLAGSPGLNIFHPDSLENRRPPPTLVLTRMSIDDEPVATPLLNNVSSSLSLPYSQNVIEFEFAAIDIDAPGLVRYRYQLEGLEDDWVEPRGRRFVRYTGLPPGDYVFKVKAVSLPGEWPDQEVSLPISIAPPWWRTAWAYLAYVLLVLGLLYAGYRVRLDQFRLKQQAEFEHFEAKHLAELDQLKSRFFANISHEFRTPLTLILGPAKQLLEGSKDEDTTAKADLIHRSARKLNRLVGELLDISRIEAGRMVVKAAPSNVVSLVREIILPFHSLAERKRIRFSFCPLEEDTIVWLDREHFEKIIGNVLSNAFKFTPEGGEVGVSLRVQSPGGRRANPNAGEERSSPPKSSPRDHTASSGFLEILIRDTGIGISPDQRDKIFDRFYQVDGTHTREHEGTGIGLSLTKELVELHEGWIEVESEEGRGSLFKLNFPLGRNHFKPEEICAEEKEKVAGVDGQVELAEADDAPGIDTNDAGRSELPSLLLVEDNADVRRYISGILGKHYMLIEARDGLEGLQKAFKHVPDLIISDIMMPNVDGFEVCRQLKGDERTSHIPLILLTAKATMESKVSGLDTGADDYIMKPFEDSELKARIRNLLEQRRRLQKHFRDKGLLATEKMNITSVDQTFLKKASDVIQEHMSDTSFGVAAFAERMAVSRSLLLKKMQALTGETPSELIRRTRLQKAAELLEASAGNVSEIALEVGFSNPSYFTECFRRQFGVVPRRYSGAKTGS